MSLRRTPFFRFHQEAGARLIDFGGWEMPVQYVGLMKEHHAVRTSAGIFDVSHMGEVWFRGPRALDAVRHLVTNDIKLVDGQAQYTAMCYPHGGIVDDLIVYQVKPDEILICCNAANCEKDFAWMVENNPLKGEVSIDNESDAWAQIAVQGRNAVTLLQKLTKINLGPVKNYHFVTGELAGVSGCVIARTGYTGEDGFEIFLPVSGADRMWPAVMEAGAKFALQPIGLGARDTLRLEMKYALYGNDIDATTSPLEAGLGWITKLAKPDFIGRYALLAQKAAGLTRQLVSLVVAERIARHDCPILDPAAPDAGAIGKVTSGTRSPSLDTNIALGYVPTRLSKLGSRVQIDVRGRIADAEVVKAPFYHRPY